MTKLFCAFYARVSSERQAQSRTIESQISALESRIAEDGGTLLDEHRFIDDSYSGATLARPALERLRDQLAIADINKLYVHSPDRLSRKYAYQMILLEEFNVLDVEVIFLNYETADNPESHLLLQMQGMIAEYERAKIMERHRRGKIHSAKRGPENVLGTAPYGYRNIDKHTGGCQASLVVNDEEASVVRRIFTWIGQERLSMGEVCRRLSKKVLTRKKAKNTGIEVLSGDIKKPGLQRWGGFWQNESRKEDNTNTTSKAFYRAA